MGAAIQEQLDALVEGDWSEDRINPSALPYIREWLEEVRQAGAVEETASEEAGDLADEIEARGCA